MNLIELDSLRADTMKRLLNEEGRGHIWTYDVMRAPESLREAIDRQNYDGIQVGAESVKAGKQYALVGPGIEDHYFNTPEELVKLVEWLCRDDGYLSCYMAHDPKLCFPIPPTCSYQEHIHNRCRSEAEVRLYAPDGSPNPGGWLCRKHAYDIIREYQEKLGERWTIRPLHKYDYKRCIEQTEGV